MFIIESIERRRMFAAAAGSLTAASLPEAAGPVATATLRPDGTLEVFGTPGRDTLVVNQDHRSPRIRVRAMLNGHLADDHEIGNFRASDVKRIVVKGGNKDDRITIDVARAMPATIEGGTGNDRLVASGGNLHLVGGAGDDDLIANPLRQPQPHDIIVLDDPGLAGHLWINPTANRLEGGAGQDTLSSVGGDDTVIGGSGDDLFKCLGGGVTVRHADLLPDVAGEKKITRDSRVAVFGIETITTPVTNEFVEVIN